MSRFGRWIVLAGVALAFAGLSPAMAQGNNWKVFVAAGYVSPLDSSDVTVDDVKESVEAADQLGWDVGGEFRSKWWGIELDYLGVTHDLESDGLKLDEVDLSLISATLNFHLIHTKIIDFYLGPTVSYADWGNIGDVSSDGETAYGVSVGADFALIKTIAIVAGLRYLQLDLTSDGETLDVNPLISRVGVAFRF